MTEGQGLAAASARATGTDAVPAADPVRPGQPPAAPPGPGPAAAGPVIPGGGEAGRHRRVDARQLEAALLTLRRRIVDVNLVYETENAEATRAERRKLLSQIDDYLLPRIRQSEAPILVALVGSTGAGKSTLVNSIVGAQVSATGIRRPTTNSPVLACHPDEADWFAENVFLPTVPRVRQEGLARSGRDGLLVLAASEGMPKGVALLDTPDIDSVVSAHRDFAHQFLDASDLWLFMTTASRYADAAVWELLEYAKERGAALGIVLSRVPPSSGAELTTHFGAMLEANGLGENDRFVINETVITDGRLPAEVSAPVREWLQDTAVRADRRVAVLTQTMAGALDTFRSRVPALAAEVEAQLVIRSDLKAAVEGAYAAGLAEADEALADSSLLRGEILARWQDFAGTGELLRGLQAPRGRKAGRQRKRGVPARARSLKSALRSGIESLILSVGRPGRRGVHPALAQPPGGRRPAGRVRRRGGHPELDRLAVRRGRGADLRHLGGRRPGGRHGRRRGQPGRAAAPGDAAAGPLLSGSADPRGPGGQRLAGPCHAAGQGGERDQALHRPGDVLRR